MPHYIDAPSVNTCVFWFPSLGERVLHPRRKGWEGKPPLLVSSRVQGGSLGGVYSYVTFCGFESGRRPLAAGLASGCLLSWVAAANADTAGRDSRWRQVMEVERGRKKGLNVSWRAGHRSSAWEEVESWAGHPSEVRSKRRPCTDEAALLCSGYKSVTCDAQQNGDGARDTT